MKKADYIKLFEDFSGKNVLIIGDVMIDSYIYGGVDRISPEAPVPVVLVNKKEDRLGGAANVALNIKALGATPIICSTIGQDLRGNDFIKLLDDENITAKSILRSKYRATTIKSRLIGNSAQMIRFDEESAENLNAEEYAATLKMIDNLLHFEKIDVIIFQDYDKGSITKELITEVTRLAAEANIPTCVDPKKRNFMNYRNVTLFKPNLKELKEGFNVTADLKDRKVLDSTLAKLQSEMNIKIAFTTLSADGVCIRHDDVCEHIPAFLRTIADVSGAGDTVISVAALCLACGTTPFEMAKIANLAGGLVCEYVGVVPVKKDILLKELTQ